MKVAGFVLAILGLIFSLIPLIGAFAIYLLIPAFLLSVIGIIVSVIKKKGKYGLAIAAVILSVIGGGIALVQMKATVAVGEGLAEMHKSTHGEAVQTEITGFGGYKLGEKLDPKAVNEKDMTNGYIIRPAKSKFRNFAEIKLYFTPKTLVVYNIYSAENGSNDDLKVIVASLEEKYKAKMGSFIDEYRFSGNHRTVTAGRGLDFNVNYISVTDSNLEKQNKKEKDEIVKSKVDTKGL